MTPTLVHVGHSKESVEAVSAVVLAILREPHTDQETKRAAFTALSSSLGPISNVTISDCQLYGTAKPPATKGKHR